MRQFLWVLLGLSVNATAAAQEPAVHAGPVETKPAPARLGAPLLSLGGGVGSLLDSKSVGAQVSAHLSYWISPSLSLDASGAVYPMLAPSAGPVYHLSLFEAAETRHEALVGVAGGMVTRFMATTGPNFVDPTVGAQLGYGVQTESLDMRCMVSLARGLRDLGVQDYFATVTLSVGALIRSSSPEY